MLDPVEDLVDGWGGCDQHQLLCQALQKGLAGELGLTDQRLVDSRDRGR